MFKKDSKYRFHFLIGIVVLNVIISVFNFYDYAVEKDGMRMISGIVFGVLALFYAHDAYEYLKNKKRINS